MYDIPPHEVVKPPGGNFQEASYQIAIASAAVLERIRTLGGDADGPPVVGWIVHGHFWTLQVSYREGDRSIVSTCILWSFVTADL